MLINFMMVFVETNKVLRGREKGLMAWEVTRLADLYQKVSAQTGFDVR